jgi:hypothetical protein
MNPQTIKMWCERCQAETLHKEIGWADYRGAMRQWFSYEENNCYNEKVMATGVQIHKDVFIQADQQSAPREKPAGALQKLLAAFRG